MHNENSCCAAGQKLWFIQWQKYILQPQQHFSLLRLMQPHIVRKMYLPSLGQVIWNIFEYLGSLWVVWILKQIPQLSLSWGTEPISKVIFNFFILSYLRQKPSRQKIGFQLHLSSIHTLLCSKCVDNRVPYEDHPSPNIPVPRRNLEHKPSIVKDQLCCAKRIKSRNVIPLKLCYHPSYS